MRAKFTKQALVNYASMVEKYGDIFLNEYGQVSLSKESHETKYQDEKKKVPSRSCMYVQINRNNFPKSVDALEEMFLRQTLQRAGNDRAVQEAKRSIGRMPEVVVGDESAFERMISTKIEEAVTPKIDGEDAKPRMGRPRKVINEAE